jgi:hypothetical protein
MLELRGLHCEMLAGVERCYNEDAQGRELCPPFVTSAWLQNPQDQYACLPERADKYYCTVGCQEGNDEVRWGAHEIAWCEQAGNKGACPPRASPVPRAGWAPAPWSEVKRPPTACQAAAAAGVAAPAVPELTVGMPRFITAGTGMDAFAHCLEAYSSPFYHPMSQGIALEGMRLVLENLPKVYSNPQDMEARAQMMSAAAMGAVAFQKGLGAIHSLSHPVGAVYGTHHGTTNAVVMPMVLEFNRAAIEDRIVRAAAYLGIDGGFSGFHAMVMDLRAQLNIPENLSAMGVEYARLDELTEMALEDPSCGGNPVAMTRENTRALYEACM